MTLYSTLDVPVAMKARKEKRKAIRKMQANKSPEPTAVGAVSSAVAVHVASRRGLAWLGFIHGNG